MSVSYYPRKIIVLLAWIEIMSLKSQAGNIQVVRKKHESEVLARQGHLLNQLAAQASQRHTSKLKLIRQVWHLFSPKSAWLFVDSVESKSNMHQAVIYRFSIHVLSMWIV
jgi:hypothetical protein